MDVLDIVNTVLTAIGIIFPIVKFVFEHIESKRVSEQQAQVVHIQGNNNSINQSHNVSNETNIVHVHHYHNYGTNASSKNRLTTKDLMVIGFVVLFILFIVFIKFSSVITVVYLSSFAVLMIIAAFSSFSIKEKALLYFVNLILMISVVIFTNKDLIHSDAAVLYSELLEKANFKMIPDYIISKKIYIVFQVMLTMILQLFVCASTVFQCLLHLFCMIYHSIKGPNDKINKKILTYLKYTIFIPLFLVFFILLVLFLYYFQYKYVQ